MKNVIAMTASDLAMLLTAYESCGSVGYREFVKMLCDEITVDDEILSEYMSYLAENGYEYYYSDLDEMLCGMNPTDDFMQWHITENMLDDFDVDEIVSECNALIRRGY